MRREPIFEVSRYRDPVTTEVHGICVDASRDTLSAKEVELFANLIAEKIEAAIQEIMHTDSSDEDRRNLSMHIIINMLRPEHLLHYCRHRGRPGDLAIRESSGRYEVKLQESKKAVVTETFTEEELDHYLKPIRSRIIELLRTRFPAAEVSDSLKTFAERPDRYGGLSGATLELTGDRVYRTVSRDEGKNVLDGIDVLSKIPEANRSRFIQLGIIAFGMQNINTTSATGIITEKVKFSTLFDLMQASEKPPLQASLRYIYQAMQGSLFLIQHHLVLTDNSLDNIAVNEEQNIGQLFDLDGLKPITAEGYVGKQEYEPPEIDSSAWYSSRHKKDDVEFALAQERLVVYEFGVTLQKVLEYYNSTEREAFRGLNDLVHSMRAYNPTERPRLTEAIATLESALQ